MAVILQTTTGTADAMRAALGLSADAQTVDLRPGVTAMQAETMPARTVDATIPAPASEPPADPPAAEPVGAEAPVQPEPVGTPAEPPSGDGDTVPDSEFDPDSGEPLTERAARSSRSKLQTIKVLRQSRREAREHAARLEGELAALRRQVDAGMQAPSAPAIPQMPPASAAAGPTSDAPKEADFDTYEAYMDARADYRAREAVSAALAAERARVQAEQDLAARQQAQQQRQAQVAAFRQEHPDYDQVINNPDARVSEAMLAVLTDPANEDATAMAYYLGTHADRRQQIAQMPAHMAAMALGEIRAELRMARPAPAAAPVARPSAPVPNVPPPPTPLRGAAAPATVSLNELAKTNVAEFIRRRNEQERQRYASR